MKRLGVAFTGLLALLYLMNPGAGVLELIPDNLPLIGNLDEAVATAILLAVLRYFGLDLTRFFRPYLTSKDPKNKTQ